MTEYNTAAPSPPPSSPPRAGFFVPEWGLTPPENGELSNRDFLTAIFGSRAGEALVRGFRGDPKVRKNWAVTPYSNATLTPGHNQYWTPSLCRPGEDGNWLRRESHFIEQCAIVLDDVREKLSFEVAATRMPKPTAILETSAGSEQWVYALTEPCPDIARLKHLIDSLIQSDLCPLKTDPGMSGVTGLFRLPEGANHKAERLVDGKPYRVRCSHFDAGQKVTLEDLAAPLGIDLDAAPKLRRGGSAAAGDYPAHPIWDAVTTTGPTKSDGWTNIECPRAQDHSDKDPGGAAVRVHADGIVAFKCHHGSHERANGKKLLEWIREDDPKMAEAIERYEAQAWSDYHFREFPDSDPPLSASSVAAPAADPLSTDNSPPEAPVSPSGSRSGDPHPIHPEAGKAAEKANETRLQFVSLAEFTAKAKAPDWLIDGLLERDSLTFVLGAPAAGKSFLSLDWAFAVATYGESLGRRAKWGRVAYLSGEGHGGMRRRCLAQEKSRGESSPALFFSEMGVLLDTPDGLGEVRAALRSVVAEHGALDLLVLDTLARTFSGDENSAQEMGRYLRNIDALKHEFGCALLVVHHTGHGDSGRARGSSALRGAADAEYLVKKDSNDVHEVRCNKLKDGRPPETFYFARRDVAFALSDGTRCEAAVIEHREPAIREDGSLNESALSESETAALTAIEEAGDDGLAVKDAREAWLAASEPAVQKLSGNLQRKRFDRVVEKLEGRGCVWIEGERQNKRLFLAGGGSAALAFGDG